MNLAEFSTSTSWISTPDGDSPPSRKPSVTLRALLGIAGILAMMVWSGSSLSAQSTVDEKSVLVAPSASSFSALSSPVDTRYGLFDLLDHRSAYGQGVFPEPFLVDDSDLEVNEARVDCLYSNGSGQKNYGVNAEMEKGFGLVTLELETGFSRNVILGQMMQGLGNSSFGVRGPLFQYVSTSGFVNSTLGVAFEVGVPVLSSLSQNVELVPKVFNDLALGKHFTLQSVFGESTLVGPGDGGGLQTFEYGFVFGYTISHKELSLPHVYEFIPMVELIGNTELNKSQPSFNTLQGDAGFRINLQTIGSVTPKLGVALTFPLNQAARQSSSYGIVTSVIVEY